MSSSDSSTQSSNDHSSLKSSSKSSKSSSSNDHSSSTSKNSSSSNDHSSSTSKNSSSSNDRSSSASKNSSSSNDHSSTSSHGMASPVITLAPSLPESRSFHVPVPSGDQLFVKLSVPSFSPLDPADDDADPAATALPPAILFFFHGVDESLETPTADKLLSRFLTHQRFIVIGVELHRHGRSSPSAPPHQPLLPPPDVLLADATALVCQVLTDLAAAHPPLQRLPLFLSGHSMGGAIAILIAPAIMQHFHNVSLLPLPPSTPSPWLSSSHPPSSSTPSSSPFPLLGCLLLAPAVDTLIDPSLGCCPCSCCCCCPPTRTHCCSFVHPACCCFLWLFLRLASCCPCLLPYDDPSTDGYALPSEQSRYRDAGTNHIGRMLLPSVQVLLLLMQRIQRLHWPGPPGPHRPAYFLVYAVDDALIPVRSLDRFVAVHRMTPAPDPRHAPATPADAAPPPIGSQYIRLDRANHQVLAYRPAPPPLPPRPPDAVDDGGEAEAQDEIVTMVLPAAAHWCQLRIQQFHAL